MNFTNENIEKAIQAIVHDHCGLCSGDDWAKCDYYTGECPYLIAQIALQLILSARKREEEESEEEN